MLKFFEIEARFPRSASEVPTAAVVYLAEQLKVDPEVFTGYEWSGRTIEYHRAQVRAAFGFREFTRGDEDKLAGWLAEEVCPVELREEQLRTALLVRCRTERIEPPGRIDRIVGSARAAFEKRFCDLTCSRLDAECAERLEALLSDDTGPGRGGLLAELKADPGQVGLETLLREIDKLSAVRALDLPAGLFADASEKLMEAWRARAARSYPSDLRAAPRSVRLTLLAALCWVRAAEITDALVDLLIGLIHKVNTRADRRVERELTEDLRRVRGKESILFRLAEAAVEHPDEAVRTALYPVVGEKTLRELVKEAKANEQVFQARVRTVLRSSYSNHYRRMLPPLLSALEFRCNNTAYRPVMQALDLLARYAATDGKVRFYAEGAAVPIDGVVPKAWREAVVDERGRIERIPYELCVLVALRDALRRREIYVVGGNRWRNPEEDLPGDFEASREVHYAALRQPTDPTEFITGLQRRMADALARLDRALVDGSAGGVKIITRRGEPWITVPKLERLPEPQRLQTIKDEVSRRWGTLDLLDVLKDSDFLTEFTTEFTSVASREVIDRDTLRRRLLLCLFALGTNMGIKAIVATGEHGETEAALRHVRRHFITRDNLRRAIAKLVNATFEVRDPNWWGSGTACASDSKKFGSWESNLMTEWHQRYGGPGVMIYWHVERRSTCIYSQLKHCSSSEVAAMMRLAITTRRARRDRAMTAGMAVRSSRTTMASAACRVRSEPAPPIAIPVCAAARAGASLMPSPTTATRCSSVSSSRTAVTLSSGSSSARTSVIPTCCASRTAAAALSPVSSTGSAPVNRVTAATVGADSARTWSVMPRTPIGRYSQSTTTAVCPRCWSSSTAAVAAVPSIVGSSAAGEPTWMKWSSIRAATPRPGRAENSSAEGRSRPR